jgi:hypothetical protein
VTWRVPTVHGRSTWPGLLAVYYGAFGDYDKLAPGGGPLQALRQIA